MRPHISRLFKVLVLAGSLSRSLFAAQPAPVPVGAAVVDITPDYSIRMVGYESRKTESEGIASRLKARSGDWER